MSITDFILKKIKIDLCQIRILFFSLASDTNPSFLAVGSGSSFLKGRIGLYPGQNHTDPQPWCKVQTIGRITNYLIVILNLSQNLGFLILGQFERGHSDIRPKNISTASQRSLSLSSEIVISLLSSDFASADFPKKIPLF